MQNCKDKSRINDRECFDALFFFLAKHLSFLAEYIVRSEGKKWIHCLESANIDFFVGTALIECDRGTEYVVDAILQLEVLSCSSSSAF
jgi:hypothetical protein